uniref:Uncharacterized protein n=1 Tax=Falco tinnunculus TaxID=100819 RepID=A0A8C4UY20_FALTI
NRVERKDCVCLILTENPSPLFFLSLENRVKGTLHEAFWGSLEEQLSASPPDYSQAIQLLQEIEEALLSQIEEALDMELIRQEAEHGALDIHGLTTYVLGTMARLCVPIRDEEVRRLQIFNLQFTVSYPREIFRVFGLMRMDMLNFTIQILRTHLQDHTIQYEQKKFRELLDKLPSKLVGNRRTATSARAVKLPPHSAVSGSPAAHSAGAASSSTTGPSLMSVLNRGYMNVLCREPGQEQYPETLLMDQARLQEVHVQVNLLTIIAAVQLVTTGICGSTLRGSPGFVARLKQVTKVLLEGFRRYQQPRAPGSWQTLSQLGSSAFTTEKCAFLKAQIKSIAGKGNAVRHVIEQRIHSFLDLFISPDGQNSQKDFPKGLDPIQEELLEVGHRFGSVIHNRQVFRPFYSAFLRALFPDAAADSDGGMADSY